MFFLSILGDKVLVETSKVKLGKLLTNVGGISALSMCCLTQQTLSLKATLEQHVDTNFQSQFSLITKMMIILERKVTTTQLVQTIMSKPHKALLSLLYQVMILQYDEAKSG